MSKNLSRSGFGDLSLRIRPELSLLEAESIILLLILFETIVTTLGAT